MKICVYAICKNERQLIDRWLDNMSEADAIVVLDTGSTDGSFEKLQKDPRVTKVEQLIVTPWRFDDARNASMKLIPKDTDICVCTDFDEVFEPGWAQVLRDNWRLGEDTRCHYTYAWSHNDLGEPQDVFKYDKIHTLDYHWIFPVHEVLMPNDLSKPENVFDAEDHIYLHHLQDKTKDRGNYLDLLIQSVKERPESAHCKMLLAREYLVKQDFETARKEYLECLEYKEIREPKNKLILLEVLGRLGELHYWCSEEKGKGIYYFLQFMKEDSTYREPYFCLADIYMHEGLYQLAIATINTGLQNSVRHYSWVERADFWIAKGEELLLHAYHSLGDYPNAVKYGKIAYEHNPNKKIIANEYIHALEECFLKDNSQTKE